MLVVARLNSIKLYLQALVATVLPTLSRVLMSWQAANASRTFLVGALVPSESVAQLYARVR